MTTGRARQVASSPEPTFRLPLQVIADNGIRRRSNVK